MVQILSRKKFLLILLLLLGLIIIYSNRRSTIEISGIETDRYHKGGKEYILAKDLFPLGFEATLEENILFLDCTVQKPQASPPNAFPAIKPDKGLRVKLNGINIDYKNVCGEVAFCIDDFCALEVDPLNDTSHPEEYYTAFQQLGYSAYCFRKNSSDSISFLPLEKSVFCNMGEVYFLGIYENMTKLEMDKYLDLENVLRKMDAKYTFQNDLLDIYGTHFQRFSIPLSDEVTNYTALGYPVLMAEITTTDTQTISAYIAKGRLKVHAAEFCEAYDYHIREENNGNSRKNIIIEK